MPPIWPGIVTDSILLSLHLGVTDKFFDNVRFFKYLRFVRALNYSTFFIEEGMLYVSDFLDFG